MSRLDQEEPTGRIDVAIARVLRSLVSSDVSPLIQTCYKVVRPDLEKLLSRHLGPKSRSLRNLSRHTQSVINLRDEVDRRLAEPL